MKLKSLGIRMVFIISMALVVGVFSIGLALAVNNQSLAPDYPKNENGQTYGSTLYATSIDTFPDLIQAVGEDGTRGYVRTLDVIGNQPKTPEEALAQQRNRDGKVRQIPLFDVDGKTVIGVFNIESGNGTVIPAEEIPEDNSAEKKN